MRHKQHSLSAQDALASRRHAVEGRVDRSTREQYRFLDYCMEHAIECTILGLSGTAFIGVVHAHDREFILFGGRSKNAQPRLIHKTYIALIVPSSKVELFAEYRGLGTASSRKAKTKRR